MGLFKKASYKARYSTIVKANKKIVNYDWPVK